MAKAAGVTEARETFNTIVERVLYQGDGHLISRSGKLAASTSGVL